jgi:outer membrane protein OmpA-like peptidoglycan-associated protein
MKNIKKLMIFVSTAVVSLALHAGIYDETYSVSQDGNQTLHYENNIFMEGDFKEIVHFDMLHFDGDELDDDYKEYADEILKKVKQHQKNQDKIKITMIGYTQAVTDDKNEKSIDSKSYANSIQNIFRSSYETKDADRDALGYAETLRDYFVENNISQDLIVVESRGARDPLFSDEDNDLSNRVMVTLYVLDEQEKDSDSDGVSDQYDRCSSTPKGAKVDKNGCPVDEDRDGVLDYKDKCLETPMGIIVDHQGCPLDSDSDGVADYQDSCPETPKGLSVDPLGCPIQETLSLLFEENSDAISEKSSGLLDQFAQFLVKNPSYKVEVIGHTDNVGKTLVNLKLSKKRAESVKKALVERGIEANRIITSAKGESEPLVSNITPKGRSLNRRIEIRLFY